MEHDCSQWTVGGRCRICGAGSNPEDLMALLVKPEANVGSKINELITKHNLLVEVVRNAIQERTAEAIYVREASRDCEAME